MNLTTLGKPWPGVAMAGLSAGKRQGEEDCGRGGLEKKGEGNIEVMEEGENRVQSPRKWVRATRQLCPSVPGKPVGWAQAWLAPVRLLWGSYSGKWKEEELKILSDEHTHLKNDGQLLPSPHPPHPQGTVCY